MLAQEVPQCQAELLPGETARIAMAAYAIGREELSAAFVSTEILLRLRGGNGQHDDYADDDERS